MKVNKGKSHLKQSQDTLQGDLSPTHFPYLTFLNRKTFILQPQREEETFFFSLPSNSPLSKKLPQLGSPETITTLNSCLPPTGANRPLFKAVLPKFLLFLYKVMFLCSSPLFSRLTYGLPQPAGPTYNSSAIPEYPHFAGKITGSFLGGGVNKLSNYVYHTKKALDIFMPITSS